jgi:ubiquinone/menaquinone biosynthesis C-methylase UbiE
VAAALEALAPAVVTRPIEAPPGAALAEYIHGGTDAREVARLEKQARWCAGWMLKRFDAAPGARVLDLATGVGAMAGRLLQLFPGIHLVGVDLSTSQLGIARQNHPAVAYARANGAALPFPDGAFERVHCSWLLEHVSPEVAVQILREARRVLAPGGYAHFTEVDNSTFRTEPTLPRVLQALSALNAGQQRAGGDPFIAPRLEGYARAAGFSRVDARPSPIRGDASDPVYFHGFIDEFAEIFESVDESLGASLDEAAAELRGLPRFSGASIHYCATIAQLHR